MLALKLFKEISDKIDIYRESDKLGQYDDALIASCLGAIKVKTPTLQHMRFIVAMIKLLNIDMDLVELFSFGLEVRYIDVEHRKKLKQKIIREFALEWPEK